MRKNFDSFPVLVLTERNRFEEQLILQSPRSNEARKRCRFLRKFNIF